jgi:hypothetical protein
MERNSHSWEERIEMALDYMRNDLKDFFKKTLTRTACLLIILITWKFFRTDWIVRIPQMGGGHLVHYPEVSSLINPPQPSAGNATFADELREFASGTGPYLKSKGITTSPNWSLMLFKILAIMMVYCSVAVMQGVWLVIRQWPKS